MSDQIVIANNVPVLTVEQAANSVVISQEGVITIDVAPAIYAVQYSVREGLPGADGETPDVADPDVIDQILAGLTGQIESSHLVTSLSSRIDLIDAGASSILQAIADLELVDTTLNTSIATDAARITANEDSLTLHDSRITATEQGYTDLSSDLAITNTNVSGLDSRITVAENELVAVNQDISLLSTEVSNIDGSVSAQAVVVSNNTTAISALDGEVDALASTVSTLSTTVGGYSAAISTEQAVRATVVGADWATGVTYYEGMSVVYALNIYQCILQHTSDGTNTPPNVTYWKSVSASLYAQYTVKLDVDGYISGFGLSNDGSSSTFLVHADKFAIGKPGASTALPFIVTDGVVYIDNARITGLTATNIAAGSITADRIATSELIVGTNITMGPSATLSWSQVTSQPTIPNGTYINSSGVYTGVLTATQVNTSGFTAQTANIAGDAIWVPTLYESALTSGLTFTNGQTIYTTPTVYSEGGKVIANLKISVSGQAVSANTSTTLTLRHSTGGSWPIGSGYITTAAIAAAGVFDGWIYLGALNNGYFYVTIECPSSSLSMGSKYIYFAILPGKR